MMEKIADINRFSGETESCISLPANFDAHPLGCHRRRDPDRDCFEVVLRPARLCGHELLTSRPGSVVKCERSPGSSVHKAPQLADIGAISLDRGYDAEVTRRLLGTSVRQHVRFDNATCPYRLTALSMLARAKRALVIRFEHLRFEMAPNLSIDLSECWVKIDFEKIPRTWKLHAVISDDLSGTSR